MDCRFCGTKIENDNAKFCFECGGVVNDEDYEGILGIEITPEDITEYVITGKLVKNIDIGNHIKAQIRTLTTGEQKDIQKRVDTVTTTVSSRMTFELEIRHTTLAHSVLAINGIVWPADSDQRLRLAEGLGSEVADILINRINLLHLAIGAKVQLRDF